MTASIVAATFIASEGDYLEAVIEVDGQRLHVMDEFGGGQMPAGAQVQIELWPMPGSVTTGTPSSAPIRAGKSACCALMAGATWRWAS